MGNSLGFCFPKCCPGPGGAAFGVGAGGAGFSVHAGRKTIANARLARRVLCLRVIDASCDESPSCVRESSTFPARVKGIKTILTQFDSGCPVIPSLNTGSGYESQSDS